MTAIAKELLFQNVLESLGEAVAVLDETGLLVFANQKFRSLGLDAEAVAGRIDSSVEGAEEIDQVQYFVRRLPDNHLLLTARPRNNGRELTATIILDAIASGKDLYQATARALAIGTGWRWGAITRFTNNDTWAEVLGWSDQGRPGKLFDYPLADAPCSAVKQTGRFCFFQDVARSFPDDPDLRAMGARTYAGQAYSDGSGRALGHVFVLHDSFDVNPDAVREIINLIVMLITAELKILELKVRVKLESAAARTDSLTSLFNRTAFNEDLAKARERFASGTMGNAFLTMIDLDGMKKINDSRGHDEGDRLLQSFARKLCETFPRDRIFRLGGDEFALLFLRYTDRDFPDVQAALRTIVRNMRNEGFPEAGASGGTADLRETAGDADELLRLADKRMYDVKLGRTPG